MKQLLSGILFLTLMTATAPVAAEDALVIRAGAAVKALGSDSAG